MGRAAAPARTRVHIRHRDERVTPLEDWCRSNGFTSIGLHVFGHNTGAWQLYKRMGYVETNVSMEKQL